MGLRYVNPRSSSNGNGLSWATAFNTFAGLSWGSNAYLVGPGTLLETITFGASSAAVIGLDPDDMPVIDCDGSRASGVNFNSATGCEVAYLRVIGQNAAAPNAAIRVTGTGHKIHHNHTSNNRHGIHINLAAGHRVYKNIIDVGRADDLSQGWGIRLNGAAATGNHIYRNRFICSRATPDLFVSGSAFGVGIEVASGVSNLIYANTLTAAMCDQIILRTSADSNIVRSNLCYGPGMLDGIDALDSADNVLDGNTIIHPGDVSGHAGPCMAIGDDYGTGVAATGTVVRNNLLWANNRLCFSIRPLGAGFVVANNRLYRTNGTGNAVANVDEGAGFVATPFADWLAKSYVTDDTYGDPLTTAAGRPLPGSPLLKGGTGGIRRDIDGVQGVNFIGARAPAALRSRS